MDYLLLFLEGLLTFISPCLLPMIPVYALYFAGGEAEQARFKTLLRALCFVLGFTAVFVALGAFAGVLGGFLVRYQRVIYIVAGAIIILFGLNYLGLFEKLFGRNLFGGTVKGGMEMKGYFSTFLFGVVFSISWTPCVGTFLGAALVQASTRGSVLHGVLLLLCYSAGLGIPFVLSAVLINQLKSGINFIKRHYGLLNKIAGVFLVVVGVLMATGLFGRWLSMLSFI